MKPTTVVILLAVISLLAVTPERGRAIQNRKLKDRALAALSQTEGRIELKGLQKSVRVLRDEWGVAHIYAETQNDLFFAQGFVAAQDRLWQMDLWRRIGEGKLAEVVGPRAVERDRFARLIRYRGDMKAEYESYAADAREIIESFVRGVNAQIELSKDRPPIEFQLTGAKPEQWTPEVCLKSFNPSKRFIATANHNILPPGYKHELGYEWANPIRFRRISEVLSSAKGKFDVADFERLQYDEVSLPARELTAVLRDIKGAPPELRPFVELLTGWDCVLSKNSAAAALFEIWLPKIAPAIFKQHVPAEAWPLVASRIPILKTIAVLKAPASRWLGSNAEANRDAAMLNSLAEAVKEARSRLGDDPLKWRWGKLHVAPFTHALSTDDESRALFNLPSVERGGDGNTVNNTSGAGFRQTHGASFREILDVSDWDRSVATNVPGQSGQPGSEHYADLLPLWAEGKYFPLLYSKQKVEAMAKRRLTLEPAK